MSSPNPLVLRSSLEIISSSGISITDFSIYAGLNDKYGLGFEDHRRALQYLVNHGFVIEHNGFLTLGQLVEVDWLAESLTAGDPFAWSFVETYPKNRWKFNPDDSINRVLGLKGERFVIQELQKTLDPDVHQQIIHSSLIDDGLGFDIQAPSQSDQRGTVYLEVKTSARPGKDFNFYLSRHEAFVGSRERQWHLVFVKIVNDNPQLLGHCPFSEISHNLPVSRNDKFEWQSTSGRIDTTDLYTGLP